VLNGCYTRLRAYDCVHWRECQSRHSFERITNCRVASLWKERYWWSNDTLCVCDFNLFWLRQQCFELSAFDSII